MRGTILREAAALVAAQGIGALTLQAIADRSGVSKGGVMHHFAGKPALVAAMRDRAIEAFAAALEANLAADPGGAGRFTRAYIRTCLASARKEADLALITALWADPVLRRDWYASLRDRERSHASTDGAMHLKLLMLAADGAWLAAMDGIGTEEWESALLAMVHDLARTTGG